MMRFLKPVLYLLFFFGLTAITQSANAQAVEVGLTVSDGVDDLQIFFGLDPSATDGLDAPLSEEELPPFPPTGTFEARFVGTDIGVPIEQGSYRDYRTGGTDYNGDVVHQIKWQLGSGSVFSITYDLPEGVAVYAQDFFGGAVLDDTLSGAGTIEITNTALTTAKMTVSYGDGGDGGGGGGSGGGESLSFTSVPVTNATVGTPYSYPVVAEDPEGDALALTVPTLPAWLDFTDHGDGTAELSGTPTTTGSYDVVLSATDGADVAEQSFAVTVEEPGSAPKFNLTFRDGADQLQLQLGLDPEATAGIDEELGEEELPPLPPSGVFEVRFVGSQIGVPLGEGTYTDLRPGAADFDGNVVHQLRLQPGEGSGISMDYGLADDVSITVEDFFGGAVVSETLTGTGRLDLPSPTPEQLKLTVHYTVPQPYEAPVVLSPADAAEGVSTAPTLKWEAVAGATGYDLQVATDVSFGSPIHAETELTATSIALEALTPMTTYYWRVRATGPDGTGAWASSRFTTTPASAAAMDITFVLSDGIDNQELHAGLDPSATEGIDEALGELELPPMPPSGSFEARFVGSSIDVPLGTGTYRDYRTGAIDFEGEVVHQLTWQLGDGESVTIEYSFPQGVSARIEDFFGGSVLNETVSGSGSFEVTNSALTQAKVTLIYSRTTNAAPYVANPISDVALRAEFGSYVVADLDTVFADDDVPGDVLTYSASANTDSLATQIDGSLLSIMSVAGIESGPVAVTVTVRDTANAEASQHFRVQLAAGLEAFLDAPADQATDVPVDVTLRWLATPGADSYDVRVALDEAMTNLVVDETGITSESFEVSGLDFETIYYWQIRAADADGAGEWSDIRSFMTTDGMPTAVTPLLPADGVSVEAGQVAFAWYGVAGVTAYHVQVSEAAGFATQVFDDSALSDTTTTVSLEADATYYWRIRAQNAQGWGPWSDVQSVTTNLDVGVESGEGVPKGFALHGAYPNPFNPTTQITLDVPKAAHVALEVFDLQGRRVAELVDNPLRPGSYTYTWEASGLASGVYLVRLAADSFVGTQRVVLLK